jgi:hypothetical protein
MLGIIECVVAVGAIAVTSMSAGRIAAMTLTALTAATGALLMPPFFSWQVERTSDLLALLFQTIVGLVIAYRWPARTRPKRCSTVSGPIEPFGRPARQTYPLAAILRRVMERDRDLEKRVGRLDVYGELDGTIAVSAVSEDQLEKMFLDILRMAFSDSKVQHVSVYTGRQPARDRISVVAEYDLESALPGIRLLGRWDSQYQIRTSNWPRNCSATYFDNGYEYIYLISIYKRDAFSLPGRPATISAVARRR